MTATLDRRTAPRLRLLRAALLPLAAGSALAQDVSVTRLPVDTDMSVRLTNLSTHASYDRSGNSYFIVPAGRYSIQLLRNGQVAYQEVEYLDADAPATRTVNPQREEIVVGLLDGVPQFAPTVCAALEAAARLALRGYGLRDDALDSRLANADLAPGGGNCAAAADIDDAAQTIAGSYGVTPLGMVGLSIDFARTSAPSRPRNRGNSPIYANPETQRISPAGASDTNLTPSLIADLKNGLPDVAVAGHGKPLIVCAAIDANTPVFCDSNGLAVSTPAIARLDGLYRFSVSTAPVDRWGAELSHWTSFVGEDDYDATQQRLSAAVAALRSNLERRIAQLRQPDAAPNAATDNQTPGGSGRGYSTAELAALVSLTQAEFDQALHDDALQPLRRHFPERLAKPVDPDTAIVSEPVAQQVFGELRNAVAVLDKVADNLAIDLVFRTAPVETEGAHLSFVACPRCAPIVSQGGQHRFYRGRYRIQATLDGYVAYKGWLDLVDDPRHILECDMVRIRKAGNGRASTCSLKSQ